MRRILLALLLVLLMELPCFGQSQQFPRIANFDGAKFAARYSLDPHKDFWTEGSNLILRDGVSLPDNPPIQETADSPVVVQRNLAKALIDAQNEIILRALLAVIIDEMNLHALKINAILDAVDGAATLAALKTAVAAIPDHPQRTLAQLRTAVLNKIDTGTVD